MNQSRIPSLDGLRAISISLALYRHLLDTENFFQVEAGVGSPFRGLGNLGVRPAAADMPVAAG